MSESKEMSEDTNDWREEFERRRTGSRVEVTMSRVAAAEDELVVASHGDARINENKIRKMILMLERHIAELREGESWYSAVRITQGSSSSERAPDVSLVEPPPSGSGHVAGTGEIRPDSARKS
jgi:hypothetical protein